MITLENNLKKEDKRTNTHAYQKNIFIFIFVSSYIEK